MKKKPLSELIPLLARGIVPTAAIATGLVGPVALAGTGDLDPGFAAVGRLGPIPELEGPAWSVDALSGEEITFAGGEFERSCDYYSWYCYYYNDQSYHATNFVGQASDAGSIDLTFAAARLERTRIMDIARQPDGKIVAVGNQALERGLFSGLMVFRLASEGPLDPTFGEGGIVELPDGLQGLYNAATSVVLDPDGRIVVAGIRNSELIVLRLLADGSLDQSFGTSGVFTGPTSDRDPTPRILRTAGGGYRVSISADTCQVVALTAGGVIDGAFGAGGIASIEPPSSSCTSLVAQPDGRLLIAGLGDDHGFATRLLANGQIDPGFAGGAIANAMSDATALAVGDDGFVVVAGHAAGVEGALVMRLQANGELDTLFGQAGSTMIDLPSDYGSRPIIHDMAVKPDGSVIAAGGDYRWSASRPFLVRLVGSNDADSPGVLGVSAASTEVSEQDREAVVKVRRTGGSSGTVSVSYQAVAADESAISGEDYSDVSGRLIWGDGEMGEQEIVVPVHDNTGTPEVPETFYLSLGDAQGGAGIGTRIGSVNILPDGSPGGQLVLDYNYSVVVENEVNGVWVHRNYYAAGTVSVTVTPVAGTAVAGQDYVAAPVTLTWGDQEWGSQYVEFRIIDDTRREEAESFTVELSNPTGGAILGTSTSAIVTIAANDQARSEGVGGGGGGATGWLSLLLLGLAAFVRRTWRPLPDRA